MMWGVVQHTAHSRMTPYGYMGGDASALPHGLSTTIYTRYFCKKRQKSPKISPGKNSLSLSLSHIFL